MASKSALTSRGVWGGLIALAPVLDHFAAALGLASSPVFSEAVGAVVSGAGALLAIWGRLKANGPIKGVL